jgi:long-chain acyl-CoA synthetase
MNGYPWLKSYDPQVPHHLSYPPVTVVNILERAARAYPHKACTIYKGEGITYQQMDELSDRMAAAFASLGIQKGDRVGILMNNLPQFVLAYFAALKAGAVVVATNPLYKPPEIVSQLNDAGVQVLLVLESLYPQVKAVQSQTSLRSLILTRQDDLLSPSLDQILSPQPSADSERCSQLAPDDFWFKDLIRKHSASQRKLLNILPEDVALFQYSGGTTGVSKAAVALHRNLAANTLQFRHWLHPARDGEETMLMAIPLYHVYGMVVGMLVAIQLGASLVMVPSPRDMDEILSSIQRYQPTLFPGVPNLYQAINQHPDVIAGKVDLSSIKACISGSAPLLPETKKRFEALTGGKLVEGYGLSEAPTATHCNPIFNENRRGSIGLPLPDVDCRIVDLEEGLTDLPIGQAGELIIQGPQVMQGYHNMPAETALALRDGWLYTGDIARMDPDGYFYLVDRKKELIKPGGFQVWPREVEEVLLRHPKLAEAAVAGVMDPQRGELVAAWVVLKPEASPPSSANQDEVNRYYKMLEDELYRICKDDLAPYKVPAMIHFTQVLPRSTVGKVLRRELVRQFSLDRPQDPNR